MAGSNSLENNWSNSPATKYNASGKDTHYHSILYNPGIERAAISGGVEVIPGDGYIYRVFLNTVSIPTRPTWGEGAVNETLALVGGPALGLSVNYLIVAGGGGGGGAYPTPPIAPPVVRYSSGGGGAGGLREGTTTLLPGYYNIRIGEGGKGGILTSNYTPGTGPMYFGGIGGGSHIYRLDPNLAGVPGASPDYLYILSTGGGGGGYGSWIPGSGLAYDGGSGGGAGVNPGAPAFGIGNSPPVSPPQGRPGGASSGSLGGGGGGYAGAGGIGGPPGTGATLPAWPVDAFLPAVPAPLQPHVYSAIGIFGRYAAGGCGGSPTGGVAIGPFYAGQGSYSVHPSGYSSNRDAIPCTGSGGLGHGGGLPATSVPPTYLAGSGAPGIVIIRYPVS
jgi:hypothetical protein